MFYNTVIIKVVWLNFIKKWGRYTLKKIKKIVAVAVAGVMMMSLAGCNIIKRTKESIGKTVLAKVGDTEITRADVDQLLYYQLNNYGHFGIFLIV